MFGRKSTDTHVRTWDEAPELAIPENPAIFSDGNGLWLAYETTKEPRGDIYAVIHFRHVIDHRLSPINDEGLGEHVHAAAGLKWYTFHEVLNSSETNRWSAIHARYWVVTFKEVTLDVIAETATVVADTVLANNATEALLSTLSSKLIAGPRPNETA
jgi:hypothetical protein